MKSRDQVIESLKVRLALICPRLCVPDSACRSGLVSVSAVVPNNWVWSNRIDRGKGVGGTTPESAEMSDAKTRIRQIRNRSRDPEDRRRAPRSKQVNPYRYKNRQLSPTQMRRLWLTGLVSEVHISPQPTYRSRRFGAELTIGMELLVSKRPMAVVIIRAAFATVDTRMQCCGRLALLTPVIWSTARVINAHRKNC